MGAPVRQLPNADAWEAAHLQLIAFATVPAVGVQQDWWRDLTGEEPQESNRKRQERVDQGPHQGRMLSLSADLLRFAWIAGPHVDAENLPDNPLPTLGPLGPAKDWFVGLLTPWLTRDDLPDIKRLAFAGKLIQRVADHESGYRTLGRYLHPEVCLDPASSDFLYRVNRRRPTNTGIPGLFINRLTTWAVGRFSFQLRAMLVGSSTPATSQTEQRFGCMLDFDLNTAHEFEGVLPRAKLLPVFGELVGWACEIAAHGDTW